MLDQPFVSQFDADAGLSVVSRRLPPPGRYEDWKSIVQDAVRTRAPPTPALIIANERLAQWESFLRIGKVSSFPTSVYFGLTDVCNARCPFCCYSPNLSARRQVSLEDIQRADWLKFSRLFSPNGNLSEPLAHPQIAQVLEAVRRQAPYINMAITTNGSLLNDRVIQAVTGHMKMMFVSLNAARKETYEAIMPPLKWDKVITNLQRLRDEKRRQRTGMPEVIVSVVAHRYNLKELPELPRLLTSIGVAKLRIHLLNVPGTVTDRQLMTAADTPQAVPRLANRSFRALERRCEANGITLTHTLPALDETNVPSFPPSPYVFPLAAQEAPRPLSAGSWRELFAVLDRSLPTVGAGLPAGDWRRILELAMPFQRRSKSALAGPNAGP